MKLSRFERLTHRLVRRHPAVRELELELIIVRNGVELFRREVYEADIEAITAHDDAQAIYDHAQEIADIIGMYQASLNTLCAPDPHEDRVRFVVDNFFEQYKGRYERRHG